MDRDNDGESSRSLNKQIHALSLMMKIALSHAIDNSGFWNLVHAMQCAIRQGIRRGALPNTIDIYLKYSFSA